MCGLWTLLMLGQKSDLGQRMSWELIKKSIKTQAKQSKDAIYENGDGDLPGLQCEPG